jgi:integrase/recombinase XerD
VTFHLLHRHDLNPAQRQYRIVQQETGREVPWINRFLDRECVRRLAETTLRSYALDLLHFLRWWFVVHHTDDVVETALTESTLADYVRVQSGQQPRPAAASINRRIVVAERALRNEFPDAPYQFAPGFHQIYRQWHPMGIGRPRSALSRLRVRTPKRNIVPLSIDEVARFWASFRTTRDLAIVGLMLLQGLRSKEVLALNRDDLLLAEAQLRVHGKGSKIRFLPLAPESIQLLEHYMRLERPDPSTDALFVSLKGRTRGARMTPAGLRSLFRYHRRTTGVKLANPHRFRHYAASATMPSVSRPAVCREPFAFWLAA